MEELAAVMQKLVDASWGGQRCVTKLQEALKESRGELEVPGAGIPDTSAKLHVARPSTGTVLTRACMAAMRVEDTLALCSCTLLEPWQFVPNVII